MSADDAAPAPVGTVGTVGFIGLGQIGAPMATRLAPWPGGLVVCDLRPEATFQDGSPITAIGSSPATGTPAKLLALTIWSWWLSSSV